MPDKKLIQLCPSEVEVLQTSEQNQGAIPFPSNEPLLSKIYFSLGIWGLQGKTFIIKFVFFECTSIQPCINYKVSRVSVCLKMSELFKEMCCHWKMNSKISCSFS